MGFTLVNFVDEFSKLLIFLNFEVNADKILESKETYTKSKIKQIVHDKKVINDESDYEIQRIKFIELFGEYIYNKLPESHKSICEFPKFK